MSQPREKPPWKRFSNVQRLPTSRTCPDVSPGCKIAKGHMLYNDCIELLQEAYNGMEPKTNEAMEQKEALKEVLSALRTMGEGICGALLWMSPDCEQVSRCRY